MGIKTGRVSPAYGMCNPIIKKMAKNTTSVTASGDEATYLGITKKTLYFMLCCALGIILFFILHNIFAYSTGLQGNLVTIDNIEGLEGIISINVSIAEAAVFMIAAIIVLFTPLIAWLIRPAIPVVGTLYALCEGYFVGMITQALTPDYKWISPVAFILTATVVGVMLFIYKQQIIKVTGKFKTIMLTLFITSLFSGVIIFILNLIPPLRPVMSGITAFMGSPIAGIILSIIYIIIAALFLLVDFDVIKNCVTNKMPKKLEWMAAFGLVYTIIYIYFKILNLIIQITSKSKEK